MGGHKQSIPDHEQVRCRDTGISDLTDCHNSVVTGYLQVLVRCPQNSQES